MHRRLLFANALLVAPLASLADHAAFQIDGVSGSAITTIGAETLDEGQQVLALQYQNLELDELSDTALLDSEEALHSVNTFSQAALGYSVGITDRFTLSGVLPYVSRDGFREAAHNHHDETDEPDHADEDVGEGHHDEESETGGEVFSRDIKGWGDLSMLGRYALTPDNSANDTYALLAGLKMPTGSTNEKFSDGEKVEVDHQPGSGSWDPLLGIAGSRQLSPQWTLSSNLLYHLRTEGARETAIGDSVQYNAAILWSPTSHRHHGVERSRHADQSWQAILEMNGEWRDKTEIDGSKNDNTGGDVIFAAAGVRWSIGDWATHLSLATPLYKDFNGEQSEPDWLLSTGVSMAF